MQDGQMPLDKAAQAHWLSSTQIDMYLLCNRKWGWRYLNKIKPPPSKYAERGNKVHKVGELYLNKGEIDKSTDYGKMFAPGIRFLPSPGTGLVEHKFIFKTETAVYVGLWDLWVPINEDFVTRIYDHKTTGDFKWMLLSEGFKTNIQCNIYSVAALAKSEEQGHDPEKILLENNWIYYRANPKKTGAKRSQLIVIPDEYNCNIPEGRCPTGVDPKYWGVMRQSELLERFKEIEKTSAEMLDHFRCEHKAMDLDYNVEGCNAYGGCPFRGAHCNLTLGELVRGHMAQETLADRMKAAQQGEQPGKEQSGEASGAPTNMAERMRAAASSQEGSDAGEAGEASKQQSEPAAVNAGEAKPDTGGTAPGVAGPDLTRLLIASEQANGIVAARIYVHTNPNYTDDVGSLAVELADGILKAAAK